MPLVPLVPLLLLLLPLLLTAPSKQLTAGAMSIPTTSAANFEMMSVVMPVELAALSRTGCLLQH